MSRLIRISTVVLLGLLFTTQAFAYIVILKDGSSLVAEKPYEVRGDKALITLPSGTQTTIPLAEIDQPETKKVNEKNYGTALVIREDGIEPLSDEEIISSRSTTFSDLVKARRTPPVPRDLNRQSDRRLIKTPAGYNDLMRFPRNLPPSPEIKNELVSFLRSSGLRNLEVYQGTQPERVLVVLVTDLEADVLRALEECARAFLDVYRRYPEVGGLEVYMNTNTRARAGQFLLTPQNAPLLSEGRITPAEFYVQYVEF